MKKFLLIFLIIFGLKIINAQSYIGFLTDNYSGVHSVINNPANIADSRYKVDINLLSISGAAFNDAYKAKLFDAIKSDYRFNNADKSFTNDNRASLNFDVLGPSVMFNINKNNSIAVSTRLRAFVNALNINGDLYNKLDTQSNSTTENLSATNQNYNLSVNNWAEFGLSYAFVLSDTEDHFFKAGLTAKYLYGLRNAYLKTDNLNFVYNDLNNNLASNYAFSGNIETGSINDVNDTEDLARQTGSGIGGDLGFVYEYRPSSVDSKNDLDTKYRIKIGLSLTDIGSINYRDVDIRKFNASRDINGPGSNGNASEEQFETLNFDQLFNQTSIEKSTTAALPTAIHLNADWNINQKFYLNLNTDFGLVSKNRTNSSLINNMVSLTPRYERKWFSAYLPLSVTEINGFQAGVGFRVGPLFLGSGSIISNLVSKTGFADVYAGLKIPLFKTVESNYKEPVRNDPPKPEPVAEKKVEKDSDGDGIIDSYDKCPTVPGEKDNKGCPWPDTDKDGVYDKDDSCVKEPGPKENKGCPWKDSDGDKVLDKDDKCPDTPGLVDNEGCPKINNDVVKKLNIYSKMVLFDNGKSTIKQESYKNLDEMVSLMKEYPTANFSIEGHTDSSGKAATNLKLSDNRAKAIKEYLISKGIEGNRLASKGFGSKVPVASNKTAKGKAQNRRVEIKLAN